MTLLGSPLEQHVANKFERLLHNSGTGRKMILWASMEGFWCHTCDTTSRFRRIDEKLPAF